jgi:hypothetical protein
MRNRGILFGLHGAAATVLLAVVFFGLITPIGLLRRLFGRNGLDLGFDPARESYWRDRPPHRPGSLRDQF